MYSRVVVGKIILEFDKVDFKDGKALNFIAGLKELVKSSERTYDSVDKVWSIDNTKENEMHIEALKRLYFKE